MLCGSIVLNLNFNLLMVNFQNLLAVKIKNNSRWPYMKNMEFFAFLFLTFFPWKLLLLKEA